MQNLSNISRLLLLLSSLCIASSLYFPIWRIDLDAPQYPEGLNLLIYHDKLGGNVDIINGLNHYIGMKTLHAEEFIEFSILRYFIIGFTLAAILVAIIKKRMALLILLIGFILFGVIAMYDFWKWEYEYGHNLDPNAAIIVPGMAYQPPLIGFKQLLNFGAYSIPDIGGWMMLIAGLIILTVYIIESKLWSRVFKSKHIPLFLIAITASFISCGEVKPEPIIINKDVCTYCKMTISDVHHGCEYISKKGKVYKFDDVTCLINFAKSHTDKKIKASYVHDYLSDNILIPVDKSFVIKSEDIRGPMGGHIGVFGSIEDANHFLTQHKGEIIDWNTLLPK